jgi:hypothetical protein
MNEWELLVQRYRAVVNAVETQSCSHGPSGAIRRGDAWRACCGVSYEYLNDIAVRDRLEDLRQADGFQREAINTTELDLLDSRLRALYRSPGEGRWWSMGFPRGVLP